MDTVATRWWVKRWGVVEKIDSYMNPVSSQVLQYSPNGPSSSQLKHWPINVDEEKLESSDSLSSLFSDSCTVVILKVGSGKSVSFVS